MADEFLGKQLYDAGWKQGTLLPVLPWSVIYNVNDPITKIAKTAKQKMDNQTRRKLETTPIEATSLPYAIASDVSRLKDYLVLISQDCDIVKAPNQIPTIFAMRAFVTDNGQIRRAAASNSTQYFLLDEKQGLVVDATIIVPIEKPVLTNFTPQAGAPNDNIKRLFAKWVAHCFNRPAFPDEVVKAVIAPILNSLRMMQAENDPDLEVLDLVKEVRIAPLVGDTPYKVNMLFITSEEGLPDKGVALARFVGRLQEWFDPEAASLVAWDASHLYEISAGDYIDTQQIYLDHYTYDGNTIRGLIPPFYPL
jgi:hypothetical protein